MAKSYISIQKQIALLQKQADVLRAKEVSGVVARIREAIEHYDLTPEEIFGEMAGKSKGSIGKPAAEGGARRKSAARKDVRAIKYRDSDGNVWSGRGPRPGWFKAALEAGKNVEDFLLK